ncbi:MAG: DotU family type IV/VI secretion system protein [Rhodospirillales bacterium]
MSTVIASGDYRSSFVLTHFHDFYAEVMRLKTMIRSGAWVFAPDHEMGVEEGDERSANAVAARITAIIDKQAVDAERAGGDFGSGFFREAQYVMAALADEVFLTMEWDGRESWQQNLVETRLFGTHAAGQVFFDKLERLLDSRDPAHSEVGVLYLLALALGFRGKYRGQEDGGAIDRYKRRLFTFVARREPDLYRSARRLFPLTYGHTLDQGYKRLLPSALKWWLLTGVIVALLLVMQHAIFTGMTTELYDSLDSILKLSRQ